MSCEYKDGAFHCSGEPDWENMEEPEEPQTLEECKERLAETGAAYVELLMENHTQRSEIYLLKKHPFWMWAVRWLDRGIAWCGMSPRDV